MTENTASIDEVGRAYLNAWDWALSVRARRVELRVKRLEHRKERRGLDAPGLARLKASRDALKARRPAVPS